MTQKVKNVTVPGTGTFQVERLESGRSLGARLPVLGSSRRNPILSFNATNNDLFPPQNNPIGFFSITFKECLFIDRN